MEKVLVTFFKDRSIGYFCLVKDKRRWEKHFGIILDLCFPHSHLD